MHFTAALHDKMLNKNLLLALRVCIWDKSQLPQKQILAQYQ